MSMKEIMKEIKELRKDRERERALLEEIAMVAGTEAASNAAKRFDYKTHAYSHATYVNLLDMYSTMLKMGVEKETALDWTESGVWKFENMDLLRTN